MKRKYLLILLSFLFFSPLFSDTKDLNFFIQPGIGISIGKLGEYLYTSDNHNSLKSYLEWQTLPLYTGSIDAGVNWKKFHLEGGAAIGLPVNCGKMIDKDWNGDLQTNLGVFDNKISQYYDFNLNLYYDFNITSYFKISPSLLAEFNYISFTTENGRGWYGDFIHNIAYDSPDAQKNIKLYPVNYFRRSLMFFAGSKFSFTQKKITLESDFYISVYSRLYAEDFHSANKDKDREYTMIILNNNLFSIFNFNLNFEYKINPTLALSANLNAVLSPILKAESATNFYRGISFGANEIVENNWTILGYVSGTDIQILSLKIGCKYYF